MYANHSKFEIFKLFKKISLAQDSLLKLSFLNLAIFKSPFATSMQLVILEIAFFQRSIRQNDFAEAVELVIEKMTMELTTIIIY